MVMTIFFKNRVRFYRHQTSRGFFETRCSRTENVLPDHRCTVSLQLDLYLLFAFVLARAKRGNAASVHNAQNYRPIALYTASG